MKSNMDPTINKGQLEYDWVEPVNDQFKIGPR
jgi:hypothetical protein